MELVTGDDIRAARALLAGVVQDTPVECSRALSTAADTEVLLKCENLQRTGSFKLRGAYHRIAPLSSSERTRGVVCASAGNHAQGVALAAQLARVAATVFMPEGASLPKIRATNAYGAAVRLVGDSVGDALAAAASHAEETGAVFVHPFDHPDVIAGQGTVGLEIVEQVPQLVDAGGTVVVPVGGGGLIAGTAVAIKDLNPRVRLVGVQAAGARSMTPSLAAGRPRPADTLSTIADGIAVRQPGELTLAHVAELVDDLVEVGDEAIARAVMVLLERAKLVVEPAGAVGVAALLAGAVAGPAPTVVVLSGGNIDPLMLTHLVTAGLAAEGRFLTLRTRVADRPGELHALLGLLADEKANVVAVEHHRLGRRLKLEEVEVVVELETRGPDHIDGILGRLRSCGYPVDAV